MDIIDLINKMFFEYYDRKEFPCGARKRKKGWWNAVKMTKLIELRFVEGNTLESTGLYFGVTAERIRQVEKKALRILRGSFKYKESLRFWLLAK